MIKNIDKNSCQRGFTLIEMMVYAAIIVVIVSVFYGFVRDTIRIAKHAHAVKEVHQNARLLTSRILEEIKVLDSAAINSGRLELSRLNPVVNEYFYLNSSDNTAYYNDGTKDYALTNAEVRVTQMQFSKSNKVVEIAVRIEQAGAPGQTAELYSYNATSTAVMRNDIY